MPHRCMSTPTSGQATNAVADSNANSAGVSEDERGGIKPSSDNVLFAGVLSEAHMKLAMIAGVRNVCSVSPRCATARMVARAW